MPRTGQKGKIMKVFTDTYNLIIGAFIAAMTAVFGVHWYVFAAYMALNIMDWLTGWYKFRKRREESSKVGLKGIMKKLGYWVIVAVSFLMSTVFVRLGRDILGINLDFLMMIGWLTLACLMINEIRSIFDNLIKSGHNIPSVLVSGLKIADEMINREEKKNE